MTDVIEDVGFDVDLYGESERPTGFLHLDGDFVDTCEKYLANDDAKGFTLRLNREEAEKLVDQIAKNIFP